MKTRLITALMFVVVAMSAYAAKIPVTGTITDAAGTRFNGSVVFTLSMPARTIDTNTVILAKPLRWAVVNGVLPGIAAIEPNVNLQPRTFYWIAFYDMTGKMVKLAPYIVSGTSFDIGTAIPTPITTNNISLQDIVGIRSIAITGNITADGSITAGGGFYGDLHGNVFGNVTSTGTSTFNILNVTTLNGTNINGIHINGPIGDVTPSTGNFSSLQLTPHVGNRRVSTDANGFLIESTDPTSNVIAASGYTWSNGLMMQWTTGTCLSSAQDQTIFTTSFPATFPNGVFQVQITAKNNGADLGELTQFQVTSFSTTSVSYYYWRNADHGGTNACPQIMAIGY